MSVLESNCLSSRPTASVCGLLATLIVCFLVSGCERRAENVASSSALESPSALESTPRLEDVDGPGLQALIREAPGRLVLVNMWSTWCAPCVEEFPDLVEVSDAFRERGLTTIFVSADLEPYRDEALEFLVDHGVAMPGYIKTGSDPEFIAALDPRWTGTLPATVIFDAEREARHFWEGAVTKQELEVAIQSLLAEQ